MFNSINSEISFNLFATRVYIFFHPIYNLFIRTYTLHPGIQFAPEEQGTEYFAESSNTVEKARAQINFRERSGGMFGKHGRSLPFRCWNASNTNRGQPVNAWN